MVQVDVFWSYGIGATYAAAAARQLTRDPKIVRDGPFFNPFFVTTLLFLGIIFVPSGICLLWAFPEWETMQAGDRNLPAWLVTVFATTNVTQGVLGYWVTYRLIKSGRPYAAYLQPVLGHFAMFFLLVYGWDGTGYQRFFSVNREAFLHFTPDQIPGWFTSPVALTLGLFGLYLVPAFALPSTIWLKRGYALDPDVDSARAARTSILRLTAFGLVLIFGATLGSAILASVLMHALGPAAGALAFAIAAYALCMKKWGPFYLLFDNMWLSRDAEAPRAADAYSSA